MNECPVQKAFDMHELYFLTGVAMSYGSAIQLRKAYSLVVNLIDVSIRGPLLTTHSALVLSQVLINQLVKPVLDSSTWLDLHTLNDGGLTLHFTIRNKLLPHLSLVV